MTRPPATYGNDQPWPDTEPPATPPPCEHPDIHEVIEGGHILKRRYLPQRRVLQCRVCHTTLGEAP